MTNWSTRLCFQKGQGITPTSLPLQGIEHIQRTAALAGADLCVQRTVDSVARHEGALAGVCVYRYADGQVLVIHDLLGMTHEFNPRFLRRYMNLYEDMGNAISQYVADVKSRDFPSDEEQY